ncbi:ABC transporter substrate-binding protein [Oceanobacillus manasiensis]|uniref:ABC transporter substrate-binding protein n=1 Tax=Oceanobacillus manasiensis TaxID=586413 RepID=UPI0005A9451E|nr:ABC transporter substrate-binding protein [Oceanobacillus manasiensis]
MKRLFKHVVILLLFAVIVSGCQNTSQSHEKVEESTEQSSEPYLTFEDFDGETVTLQEKPQYIVILKDEVLHSFYQVGGEAAGITNAFTIEPPEEAIDVPKVGFMHEVNMEKVFELKPDLVIGQRFTHGDLRDTFKEAGIAFANLNTQSIEEIRENTLLMGEITDNQDKAEALIKEMDSEINQIVEQIPDDKEIPTYAIMTIMGDAAFVEQGPTIGVDIANQLKLKNVTESLEGEVMAGFIPFSMEAMVEVDPDYLFILSHTTDEDAVKIIENNYKSNSAWKSLSAVTNDRLYFLPTNKFVMAPGVDVVDSYKYMADIVYSYSD